MISWFIFDVCRPGVAGKSGEPPSGAASFSQDQEIALVISGNLSPYDQALEGFIGSWGSQPPVLNLAKGELTLPKSTKVVMSLGSKAAYAGYSKNVTLVYALAPAVWLTPEDHAGPRIKIFLTPSPEILVAKMKSLQPSLKRMGIIRSTWIFEDIMDQIRKRGRELGVEVLSTGEGFSVDSFPDLLRLWKNRVQAIWLPPDPELISPAAWGVLSEFCQKNHIGLIVPSEALVEKGALASIAPSFEDAGFWAAWAAREALAGRHHGEKIFPQRVKVVINLETARQSAIEIPQSFIDSADRVVR
ncbi:MAG: hypothetical protein HY547_01655 [Elusimicrobia bacterium]|nr:hypothetical protein [Elusimicrobiota bacterium]